METEWRLDQIFVILANQQQMLRMELTLNPNSPGFSGSKSYSAVQHGPVAFGVAIGVLAGERIGDGNGEAENE